MVFVTTSGFSTGPAIMIEVHLWPEALPSMTFFRLQGHVTRPPKTSSSRWSTLQSPVIPPTCSPPGGGLSHVVPTTNPISVNTNRWRNTAENGLRVTRSS
ncbi:hypothetical protein E4T56_gene8044 [Termitomyces sp. T112]|nr:hypothetical protein E4T56_gene8044 [Termitomyces sp. T112]